MAEVWGFMVEELSRKKLGDFPLTEQVRGWWDRGDTEIDLVAVDEGRKTLRLGTCKRNPERLVNDLAQFDGHIERFLTVMPRYRSWTVERVAIAPALDTHQRAAIAEKKYLAQDLRELSAPLLS